MIPLVIPGRRSGTSYLDARASSGASKLYDAFFFQRDASRRLFVMPRWPLISGVIGLGTKERHFHSRLTYLLFVPRIIEKYATIERGPPTRHTFSSHTFPYVFVISKKVAVRSRKPRSIVIEFKRETCRSPLAPASPTMHIQHRASLQKRSAMSILRVITKRPRIVHSRSRVGRGKQRGWREEGRTRKRKGWERRGPSIFVLSAGDSHLAGRGWARAFLLSPFARAEFHAANIFIDNEKARGLARVGLGEDARAMFPVRTRERHWRNKRVAGEFEPPADPDLQHRPVA